MDLTNITIAIASGKGGTGKTTVSTNLAITAVKSGQKVAYFDCDVEEPNGHIFLKPEIKKVSHETVWLPDIDDAKCDQCGKCVEICQFNAIALFGQKILTFPYLCHSCLGCKLVCPTGAIADGSRDLGIIEEGYSGELNFCHGKLNIGEGVSSPLIHKVKSRIPRDSFVIIDAPPGTTCPVVQSVKDTDYVILVTEPTPFGLNDLKLAVEMLRALNLPFGVVINRSDIGDNKVTQYCASEGIIILAEIPHDIKVASAYSKGLMVIDEVEGYTVVYQRLLSKLRDAMSEIIAHKHKTISGSKGISDDN